MRPKDGHRAGSARSSARSLAMVCRGGIVVARRSMDDAAWRASASSGCEALAARVAHSGAARRATQAYPIAGSAVAEPLDVRPQVIVAAVMVWRAAHADEPANLDEVGKIEDLSLEQLLEKPIVAASNIEQRPKDSPAVVSVIDGDDLRRIGARDLGSALAATRGIYATNDRNYSYLGIRGISTPGDYNTRILLTIDDHKITDPVYGQAMTGVELGLPLGAIQRIELVRGAASSTYGSSALLGAVHIVTSTGATRPGLHVSSTTTATAETFADPAQRPDVALFGQEVSASYGVVTAGGTDVFAAGSYLRAPGLRAIYMPELASAAELCVDPQRAPVACNGVVRDVDHEEAASAYLGIHRGGFRLSGLASTRFRQIPTASFGTVIGDPDTHTTDNRIYLDGGYHAALGAAELDAHASWDFYNYRGRYAYYTPPDDGDPSYPAGRSMYHDAATSHWLTGEARLRWRRGELVDGVTDVDTIAGAEVVAVPKAYQIASETDRTDHEVQIAAYGQAEARIAERLVASAGARIDVRPDSYGASGSSRLGLLVDAWHEGRLRFTFGSAFRAPNLYERYYFTAQATQPTLQPERAYTYELSAEQYLGDHVRLIIAGYRNDLDDLTQLTMLDNPGQTAGDRFVFHNGGEADGRGAEAEIEARWQGTQLRANLAVQRSHDETGANLPNSPHTLANISLVVPLAADRARLAIASSFVGHRNAPSGAPIDAAFQTDVAVEVPRLGAEAVDLGLGVSNLFDQRSAVPGSEEHRQSAIPRDPRLVWIRIGLHL
ncbi:MAG: TonB-dependent receptor [Deltaproteobacteria bacterium]|nr:MAG: TonB-dependent receptor [Deltaproteobacteria bacterium]